jgi:hypothetical protein
MERIIWEEEEKASFISKDGKEIFFTRREARLNEWYVVQASKFFKNIQISLIEVSLEPGYGEASENLFSERIIKNWKVPIPSIQQEWTEIKTEIFNIVGASEYGAK